MNSRRKTLLFASLNKGNQVNLKRNQTSNSEKSNLTENKPFKTFRKKTLRPILFFITPKK